MARGFLLKLINEPEFSGGFLLPSKGAISKLQTVAVIHSLLQKKKNGKRTIKIQAHGICQTTLLIHRYALLVYVPL